MDDVLESTLRPVGVGANAYRMLAPTSFID